MFFLSKFLNYDSLSLTFFLSFIILCLCIALSLSLSSIILCLSLCYHCVDLSHLFSLFQVELLGVIHSFYKGGPITLCCVAFIILGDNNSSVTISPPLTKDPLLRTTQIFLSHVSHLTKLWTQKLLDKKCKI